MTAVVEDRRVRRTKAALQQAMVELVVEQGYESISIDALAGRADVTRATFYAHYANKAALLTAVVDQFADEVVAALEATGSTDARRGALKCSSSRRGRRATCWASSCAARATAGRCDGSPSASRRSSRPTWTLEWLHEGPPHGSTHPSSPGCGPHRSSPPLRGSSTTRTPSLRTRLRRNVANERGWDWAPASTRA